ncbi:MarR family winged helix-turn-helix transcriptional regulator [Janibacter limosus]|uniref:MarR family winged helix-turn-helix transcriptional regulator n=1 Tax=Janibacter limosus TaxID=53458 RepID=UPI00082B7483|nr:MarR family winged helix-turn-helix transcriptional regulator [Janibacter limosus]
MTFLTPDDGPAWTAIRVATRWSTVRRGVEAGQQLKVAEGRLLWLLRDGQPRTLRQLAEELDLEQSTVNRQVHAALDSGLIVRSRPEDSPAYVVTVSDEGGARFRSDMARLTEVYERALAAIPRQDQDRFLQQLATFVEGLDEASHATLGP